MDLVINVISGPEKGQTFPVPPGSHVIGRGQKAAVKLSPEDVSWEHAVLTREGDDYFIENLSALGTWVGDTKVAGRVRLRPRDKIRLSGDCIVRLEPPGGGGLFSSRAFLGLLLSVMLSLAVAAVFYSGEFEGSGSSVDDWDNAHRILAPWLEKQATKGRVPREAVDLFDRVWRLEQTHDYENAAKLWLRMQIVLSTTEKNLKALELAGRDPDGKQLTALLRPNPKQPATQPSDDQLAAALAQFVNRRLAFASKQNKGGILKRM